MPLLRGKRPTNVVETFVSAEAVTDENNTAHLRIKLPWRMCVLRQQVFVNDGSENNESLIDIFTIDDKYPTDTWYTKGTFLETKIKLAGPNRREGVTVMWGLAGLKDGHDA